MYQFVDAALEARTNTVGKKADLGAQKPTGKAPAIRVARLTGLKSRHALRISVIARREAVATIERPPRQYSYADRVISRYSFVRIRHENPRTRA